MKEIIRRIEKLKPKSILTRMQIQRLVEALGEALAMVAEENLNRSKPFCEFNAISRDSILQGYLTVEERTEIANVLNDPTVSERMEQSLKAEVIKGNPFASALNVLTREELHRIIDENNS